LKAIIGRDFKDPPVKIQSLCADVGLVSIRGKLSHLDKQFIIDETILLITFVVTDDTSSILCKAFLQCHYPDNIDKDEENDLSHVDMENEIILKKYRRLEEASAVKVRGECMFDQSCQKLTYVIRDLVEIKEENVNT